jgi:adenylate cyclase class 2
MAIEIELKAWVDDPASARRSIATFATPTGSYRKDDSYWRYQESSRTESGAESRRAELGSGIRIRREDLSDPAAVVNFKRKEVRDGIEVNDEREFEVSDAAVFGDLLSRLGLAVWIRKRKIGEAWRTDGVTIELSEIEGLGFFAELEILAEVDDAATVADARKRLLATLARIGIDSNKIETRYYTEMLAQKAKG